MTQSNNKAQCTVVYVYYEEGERYHGNNRVILHLYEHEVSSRTTPFRLRNNLPGMCTCMCSSGHHVALHAEPKLV